MKTDSRSFRDAAALEAALSESISGEVRFDRGARALYATDASNYRQIPIGVVVPKTTEDVVRTIECCRRFGAPVLSRGGGTSLAGQCCNVAVVIDHSKYLSRVLEIDPDGKWARIQPGIVLDELRRAAERHGLTFGPDPATHNHCTLGGMIGNNSCGVHALMAGKTSENVISLDVLTYDGARFTVGRTSPDEFARIVAEGGRRGAIYRDLAALRDRLAGKIRKAFPDIPRCVSGFDLPALLPENGFDVARALVGSEGTCVTVLEATVRLVHHHPYRSLVVLGYPSIFEAADHVPDILRYGPIGLEGIDDQLIDFEAAKRLNTGSLPLLPKGNGFLIVEFGGDSREEADDRARSMAADLRRKQGVLDLKVFEKADEMARIWKIRESGLGATAFVPGRRDSWPGWEDSAVAVDKLGSYLRDLQALFEKNDYHTSLYGHFGQGCVHCRIPFDVVTRPGIDRYHRFIEDAADLVVRYGGSLSGEHGDGQSRGELLGRMFEPDIIKGFESFKEIWDPDWKMNPGKVVRPRGATDDFRLGRDYNPPRVKTNFRFPDDRNDFARAALRCVGVGECRKHDGGVMCPSYMATREEKHSTRGRAHLLFEMLRDGPLGDGWRSEPVKEALDLCLACKGCKGECPVNVDMASYKAEFLSHYYKARLRPRSAYAFGLIMWWSRLAMLWPAAVNAVTQNAPFRAVAKFVAGASGRRRLPRFAAASFQSWARRRTPRPGRHVILWPDTFNNYFHTETAKAAHRVLTRLGYRVHVPPAPVCCGRPLYDYGFLSLARRFLANTIRDFRPLVRRGVPIIGLEPSCVSVFRDEVLNLFPDDLDAQRLSQQTFLLGEFLVKEDRLAELPHVGGTAVVQGHCHQKSLFGMDADARVLASLGIEHRILDTGCCGMAGAFGFEADKYDVSVKIAEHGILRALEDAPSALVIADGFSCRTQIEELSNRKAMHLAEVIDRAWHREDGLRINDLHRSRNLHGTFGRF